MDSAKSTRFVSRLIAIFALAIFFASIWIAIDELRSVSIAEVGAQFNAIPFIYFVFAGLLTAMSYFVLTGYDYLGLKYVGLQIPYRTIAPISFSAFAVGHNVGVASLSGGAIRYRAFSIEGLTSTQIAILIAFVPITFGLGAAGLLALVLLIAPAGAMAHIPVNLVALRLGGMALLLLVVGYLLSAEFRRHPLKIGAWTVGLPTPGIAVAQVFLGCTDFIVTSLVLFVLLRSFADISYFSVLIAFILALSVSVASNIPGGIGIFESSMVLLLPDVPVQILLSAVFAYRIIYFIIPLLLAVSLIAFREVQEQKNRLRKISKRSLGWASAIIPQTIGSVIFIAGAYLLMRGSIPLDLDSREFLKSLVPLQLVEMSHLLSSSIGVGLLLVARGLYRRLLRAWVAALALLGVGLMAGLVQHQGWTQTGFLSVLLLSTWFARAEFYRGTRLVDQRFSPGWVVNIAMVLITAMGVGLLANKNIQYSNELWWQFTFDGDAPRMLRASLLALILLGVFVLLKLLRGEAQLAQKSTKEEICLAKKLISIDQSSLSNVALLGDKRFLFHPSGEAFLMYQISGRTSIVLGDPIGNTVKFEELLWQYREFCDLNDYRCAFYQVGNENLHLYVELGLSFLKLGEEGIVDLSSFDLEGSARADLRQALSKAKRNGAEFLIVPAEQIHLIIDELASVSDSWLLGKSTEEKGFSLGYFDREYISNFDCAVVRVNNQIVAFANLWIGGTRKNLSLDLMRYSEMAPKGIMDYIFVEVMLWGRVNGFVEFSLGMAPLSGLEEHDLASVWHKVGNLIFHFGEDFYNFDGLRSYKEKFNPKWESRFLACKGGFLTPAVLLDTTVLISGGLKGLITK